MDGFHLSVKSHGSRSSTLITALTIYLVPATALLSIKRLCVCVPQVPDAGLWGTFSDVTRWYFLWREYNAGFSLCLLVSSSLLYPCAKEYCPVTG